MKKIFSLLLLGLLCSIGTMKAQTAVTASWLPESNSMTLVGVTSDNNGLIVSDGVMTSALKTVSTWSKDEHYYLTFDRNDDTQDSKGSINLARYIDFVATVAEGVNFTLNTAEAVGIGAGTGNNSFRVDFIDADGTTTLRNAGTIGSGTIDAVSHNFASPKTYAAGSTIKIRLYVGINNTAVNKNVGFRDVKLIGTYQLDDAPNAAPTFTTNLPAEEDASVGVEKTLSVVVAGKPIPTYQWYSCADAQKTGAQAIDNATSSSYSFTPNAAGSLYYYVVASNSEGTATSNVVTVTVSQGVVANPTFKVYGNTVQIECTTEDATIYYELGNANVKTSETKVQYNGAFIPAASGTIYAYAQKDGFASSEVVSQAVTLSTVGDVVGDLVVLVQPANQTDPTVTYNDITISSNGTLEASARGVYVSHFKASGTITLAAANGKIIKSIKIIGTSNDGSKVSTITAGDGATVVSTPAELMQRDVRVDDVQAMTEIVITVDAPAANNSVSFTLGRESRFYVEVYGEGDFAITPASDKSTFVAKYALDFSGVAGLAAYVASIASADAVSLTQVTTVPAGTPLILIGTAGTEYSVPVVASAAAPAVNLLVAGTGAAINSANLYVLSEQSGNIVFASTEENEAIVPVGKAYLDLSGLNAAPVLRIVEGENNATNIENLDASEKAVKFIKNGQLFIQKDGVVYTATGAVVR